jgi:hypothetical protein
MYATKYINFEFFFIFDIFYNSFNKHGCDTKKLKRFVISIYLENMNQYHDMSSYISSQI